MPLLLQQTLLGLAIVLVITELALLDMLNVTVLSPKALLVNVRPILRNIKLLVTIVMSLCQCKNKKLAKMVNIVTL
jgi:hypothetical protein